MSDNLYRSLYRLSRRAWLGAGISSLGVLLLAKQVKAIAADEAIALRFYKRNTEEESSIELEAARIWARELMARTSIPARSDAPWIPSDSEKIIAEPFLIWRGSEAPKRGFSEREKNLLRRFFSLGGLLIIDDSNPESGEFRRWTESALSKLIDGSVVRELKENHVLFKSFYLIPKPEGRVLANPAVKAMSVANQISVIWPNIDLLGGLAMSANPSGGQVTEDGAIRFSVNLSMFLLCTDYKNDVVHAEELMRRRGSQR